MTDTDHMPARNINPNLSPEERYLQLVADRNRWRTRCTAQKIRTLELIQEQRAMVYDIAHIANRYRQLGVTPLFKALLDACPDCDESAQDREFPAHEVQT